MQPRIGFAMRTENRPLAGQADWTAVEIDFRRANQPLRVEPYLAGMHFPYVSLHTLELSIASPQPPSLSLLDTLKVVAEENGAQAISDHLGFNQGRAGGAKIGHVVAPPPTIEALDHVCRNLEYVQKVLQPYPVYIENLAHFFQLRGPLEEADFIRRMLDRTGCGLLFDVTNAYANEINFGDSTQHLMAAVIPVAAALQLHVAGGYFHAGFGRYIDSHSQPISPEIWELAKAGLLLATNGCDGIFIERDWDFPTHDGWRQELASAHQVAGSALAEFV